MGYKTFVARSDAWILYPDIGVAGSPIAEQRTPFSAVDFSIGSEWIWIWDEGSVCRLDLLTLAAQHIPFEGRVGAVGGAPDGNRAAAIALPGSQSETPRLVWWDGFSWERVEAEPDISSKVAWLGDDRIAFESADRRLAVADLGNRSVRLGPQGSNPVAAHEADSWFAIVGGKLVRFPATGSFDRPAAGADGFDPQNPVRLWFTPDAQVCTWKQPKILYRTTGHYQVKGKTSQRFPEIDEALGAVVYTNG